VSEGARLKSDATPLPGPHHGPQVLSRPEPVYVYEVAAQELAPVEGELWQEPSDEIYEEADLLRSAPSTTTEGETLPFEVAAATRSSHSSTSSQAKGEVTPEDSPAEASGSRRSKPPSGEGSSAPGGGSQGRLFEGRDH